MTKNIWLILLLLVACTPSNNLKIGVIAPMSGDFGSIGQEIERGFSLADLDVEIIYEDACLPKETTSAINKLIHLDQVNMLNGIFCIVSVEPILTISEDRNIMMVASVSDDLLDKENLFSTNFAVRDEAFAQAELAIKEHKTAAILYIRTPFGESYNKNFRNKFEELGGEVVLSEPLDIYGRDFRTALQKVKAKNPDLMLIAHIGKTLGIILKQTKELGIGSTLLGNYEAEDQVVIDVAGKSAEGFIISAPKQSNTDFDKKYEERYNKPATPIAKNAYDALNLQVNAYKACSGDNKCIKEYISKSTVNGASGTFTFTKEGTAKKEIMFKQVINGVFTKTSQQTTSSYPLVIN
ncbi:MAG: ABC transporter substrate-binding protein [Candidatus Nanoarchaeia archaeon]